MLKIQLFGGNQITQNGVVFPPLNSFQLQKVLAYITLHRKQPIVRKQFAYLFWPECEEQRAIGNLRNILYRLKKNLPFLKKALEIDKLHIRWSAHFSIDIDVEQFRVILQRAFDADLPTTERFELLEEALLLYKGDLLPWCYDDWLLSHRELLTSQHHNALHQALLLAKQLKKYDKAIHYGQILFQEDPYNEELLFQLMQLHMKLNDRAGALQSFQEALTHLQQELGVGFSSEELLEYQHQLLEQTTQKNPTPLPKTSTTPRPTCQDHLLPLPVYLTPFLGRTTQKKAVCHKLRDPQCRLLTLTGLGGTGKTRLAVEIAKELWDEFEDHCAFFSLSDSPTHPGSHEPQRKDLHALRTHLLQSFKQRHSLLILDSAEENIPESIQLAELLLSHSPQLTLLLTSRTPLHISGEWIVELSGLSLPKQPSLDLCQSSESIELLEQSARRISPDFALTPDNIEDVWQICKLVDGMPLGIELAALWMKTLSPQELRAELEQDIGILQDPYNTYPPKHQAIWQILESAMAPLSITERQALERLSVFEESFSKEAARDILGISLPFLQKMLNTSLLKRSPQGRFFLHPLLGQYLCTLRENQPKEEEATFKRFCNYYAKMLQNCAPGLEGPDFPQSIQDIGTEIENIYLASQWAAENQYAPFIEKMITPLELFYRGTRRYKEGLSLFSACLEAWVDPCAAPGCDIDQHQWLSFRMMSRQAILRCYLMELEPATNSLKQCLNFFRDLQHNEETIICLNGLGHALGYQGLFADAKRHLQEALLLQQHPPHPSLLSDTFYRLSYALLRLGEYDESVLICEKGLAYNRQLQNPEKIAMFLQNRGVLALLAKEFQLATSHFQEAEEYYQLLADDWCLVHCYINLGDTFSRQSKYPEAFAMFEVALALCRKLDYEAGLIHILVDWGYAKFKQQEFDVARNYLLEALTLSTRLQAPPLMLDALICLAALSLEEGHKEIAAEILLQLQDHQTPRPDFRSLFSHLHTQLDQMITDLQSMQYHNRKNDLPAFARALVAELKARWRIDLKTHTQTRHFRNDLWHG